MLLVGNYSSPLQYLLLFFWFWNIFWNLKLRRALDWIMKYFDFITFCKWNWIEMICWDFIRQQFFSKKTRYKLIWNLCQTKKKGMWISVKDYLPLPRAIESWFLGINRNVSLPFILDWVLAWSLMLSWLSKYLQSLYKNFNFIYPRLLPFGCS